MSGFQPDKAAAPRLIENVTVLYISAVAIPRNPDCWIVGTPADVRAIGNAVMRDGDEEAYAAFARLAPAMVAAARRSDADEAAEC